MIKDTYIKTDLLGYRYNSMFPPNSHKSRNLYHGYKAPSQECLFYDFAVQGFDLMIQYKDQKYYFMVDTNCVWLSDESFSKMTQRFNTANEVLCNFKINGIPLYQLVDKLEDFEPM